MLFIGDVVGRAGRDAVSALLPSLVKRHKIDFVIANGENAAGGFGITEAVAKEMFRMGVHAITSGNHIWDKKEAVGYASKEDRLLRPANYPPGVPGFGSLVHEFADGSKIAVLNISGRVFMQALDCPFRTADKELERLGGITKNIVIDFHAEATSEKVAFGYFVDGKASAVIGTHTHVQTADEKILPGGTAYITDVGMTGPVHSVIGMRKEEVLERFLLQMPSKFDAAKGDAVFSAAMVEIEGSTGLSAAIKRLHLTHP